jgi:hypothetical protein
MKKLPEIEYNFYEISDRQASEAFWYEYSRSSKSVLELVSKLRSARLQGDLSFHRSAEFQKHRLRPVLQWLEQQGGFPKLPYLKLPTPGAPRFRSIAAKIETSLTQSTARLEKSEARLTIDWKMSDAQIKRIVGNFLSYRPEQYADFKNVSNKQQSFDGLKLPFRKERALNWLGFWRRKNGISWRDYYRIYHRGHKWTNGEEKARSEDCRKAKLILDWFEGGAELNPADFK